jgi:hypothetical protein
MNAPMIAPPEDGRICTACERQVPGEWPCSCEIVKKNHESRARDRKTTLATRDPLTTVFWFVAAALIVAAIAVGTCAVCRLLLVPLGGC